MLKRKRKKKTEQMIEKTSKNQEIRKSKRWNVQEFVEERKSRGIKESKKQFKAAKRFRWKFWKDSCVKKFLKGKCKNVRTMNRNRESMSWSVEELKTL
jgi:hypothetical protein